MSQGRGYEEAAMADERSWDEHFELLKEYCGRHDGNFPSRRDEDWTDYRGKDLYAWASNQRHFYLNLKKGRPKPLRHDRLEKLRSIGFDFERSSSHEDKWNGNFAALLAYRDKNGGSLVVHTNDNWDEYGGTNLYAWVTSQRTYYRNGLEGKTPALSKERIQKLESIGFQFSIEKQRSPPNQRSPNGKSEKPAPKKRSSPSGGSQSDGSKAAGPNQVPNQKTQDGDSMLPAPKKRKTRDWDEYLAALVKYRENNGGRIHVRAKESWDENYDGLNLFSWVRNQRSFYRNGQTGKKPELSVERIEKLRIVGFQFCPGQGRPELKGRSSGFTWGDNHALLLEMLQQPGQTLAKIEASHDRLKHWLKEQRLLHRINRSGIATILTPDRVDKLRLIGFDFGGPGGESATASSDAQQQRSGREPCEDEIMTEASRHAVHHKKSRPGRSAGTRENETAPLQMRFSQDNMGPARAFLEAEQKHRIQPASSFVERESRFGAAESSVCHQLASKAIVLSDTRAQSNLVARQLDEEERRLEGTMENVAKAAAIVASNVPAREAISAGREDECVVVQQRSPGSENIEPPLVEDDVEEVGAAERDFMDMVLEGIQQSEACHQWLQDNTCVDHESSVVGENDSWKTSEAAHQGIWKQHHRSKSPSGLELDSLEGVQLMRAVRRLPKYLKSLRGTCEYLLTDQDLDQNLVPEFKSKYSDVNLAGFSAFLRDTQNREHSLDLVLVGSMQALKLFSRLIRRFLTAKAINHNYQLLLFDGHHVAVELDSSKELGAELYTARYGKSQGVLLRLRSQHSSGQLACTVGKDALSSGAAIFKVDGSHCYSVKQFTSIVAQKKEEAKQLSLELLVSKDTVHSAVTGSRVISPDDELGQTSDQSKSIHANLGEDESFSMITDSAMTYSQQAYQIGSRRQELSREVVHDSVAEKASRSVQDGTSSSRGMTSASSVEKGLMVATSSEVDCTSSGGRTTVSPAGSQSSESQLVQYDKVFNSTEPLGFYCDSTCEIISICPSGQAEEDIRIQAGTLVVSARIGGNESISIQSCPELKALFDDARSRKADITLTFINSNVTESPVGSHHHRHHHHHEWVGTKWRLKMQSGWAGGAECVHSKTRARMKRSFLQERPASTTTSLVQKGAAVLEKAASAVEWVKRVSISKELSSTKLKPILVKAGKPKRSRKVQVQEDPVSETRMFYSESPTTHFLVPSNNVPNFLVHPSQVALPAIVATEESLCESIYKGNLKDTLAVVNSGAAVGLSSQALEKMRNKVKEEISFTGQKISSAPSESLQAMMKNWQLLGKLLKIYLDAKETITRCIAVNHWVAFEVKALQLDNLHGLSSALNSSGCVLDVQALRTLKGEKNHLKSLPQKPFSNRVNLFNQTSFFMNYNSLQTPDMQLEFRLRALVSDDPEMKGLGSASINVSELNDQVGVGVWCERVLEIVPRGGHLQCGASLKMQVRQHHLDQAARSKRKLAAQKQLQDVVGSIVHFNGYVKKADQGSSLSANIRAEGGSLLHAACCLADQELVQKLLELGADPGGNTTSLGSPLQLVTTMADCQNEEDQQMQLEMIANILQRATKRQQPLSNNTKNRPPAFEPSVPDPDPDDIAQLPVLDQHWVVPPPDQQYICRIEKCGDSCRSIHLVGPFGDKLGALWESSKKVLPSRWLLDFNKFACTRAHVDTSGRQWFTAGLLRTLKQFRREIFLAEGGETGKMGRNGITWYPSEDDALQALQKVIIVSLSLLPHLRSTSTPIAVDDTSSIDPQWMIHPIYKPNICRNQGQCPFFPKGQCTYIHFHPPVGDKLDALWETSGKQLPGYLRDFEHHAKMNSFPDSSGKLWFTAALPQNVEVFTCNRVVFLAEGGSTARMDQNGINWYPTKEDALLALEKVVVVVLSSSK